MNSQTKLYVLGAALFVAGLMIGYYAFAPQTNSGAHMMHNGTMMAQDIDQHFIAQMIPHHEGAIDMAKLALQKAKHPELKTLATNIIAAQEKEITDMRAWYRDWYNSEPTAGGMGMHMSGMSGDMEVLAQASGDDFDRLFVQQMIPHHEMAVMMASMLEASTMRPEMQTLAKNIIASQSSEIEMMRGWLREW